MSKFRANKEGYYGEFGGAYIPEILHKCVTELQRCYQQIVESSEFQQEYKYLKREDLNHTGAHKINNLEHSMPLSILYRVPRLRELNNHFKRQYKVILNVSSGCN